MTEDQLVDRVANVIERSMFAPHEMPLDDQLHAKYLETARAAREFAPFPARALRDRPWDISALVARQGGSDGDD